MKKLIALLSFVVLLQIIGWAEQVPSAKISLDRLTDTPTLNGQRKASLPLDKVLKELESSSLEGSDKTQMSINCQEFLSDNGHRYQMPPEPLILGKGDMTSEDGRFVRIYSAFTGSDWREIDGRNQFVNTFILSIDYRWHGGRGILLIPYWVVLDRTDSENPKVKRWGVDDQKVSHIKQEGEQDGGGQPATQSRQASE